jgi:hypothetical protein
MSDKLEPGDTQRWQRHFASQSNNHAWRLSELHARTPEQDEEMLHAAHAAMYLWASIGNARNHAHAAQLLAHVYALLGMGAEASRYQARSQAMFFGPDAQPWEVAIAHAVAANVAAANGEGERHAEHHRTAARLIAALASAEERKILESTLDVVPRPAAPGAAPQAVN